MIVIQVINTITAVLFLVSSIGLVYCAVKLWRLFKTIDKVVDEHFFEIRKKTAQLDELIKRHNQRELGDIQKHMRKQSKLVSQADKYRARR